MKPQNRFKMDKLRSLELKTFFHPAFLAECGFVENQKEVHAYFRLHYATFFRTANDLAGFKDLHAKAYGPPLLVRSQPQEVQERRCIWEKDVREYCERLALKTVGDLEACDGIYAFRWKHGTTYVPSVYRISKLGQQQAIDAMKFFGLRTPGAPVHSDRQSERARAIAAAKQVLNKT